MAESGGDNLSTQGFVPPAATSASQARIAWVYWFLLFALILASLFFPERTLIGRALAPLGAITIPLTGFAWVLGDARAHGVRLSRGFKLGVILLSIVFVPIHLFRTRRAARVFLTIGLFFLKLFALALLAAVIATALGVQGPGAYQ